MRVEPFVRLQKLSEWGAPWLLYLWSVCVFFPLRALGNLALVFSLLFFVILLVSEDVVRKRTFQEPVFVFSLALFFLAYVVSVETHTFGAGWSAFYSYDGPGKALLIGVSMFALKGRETSLNRLFILVFGLLGVLNVFQLQMLFASPVFLHPESYSLDAFYRYRNFGAMQLILCPFLVVGMGRAVTVRSRGVLFIWFLLNFILLASTGFRGAWLGFFVGCCVAAGRKRLLKAVPYSVSVGLALALLFLLMKGGQGDSLVANAIRRGLSDNNRIDQVWRPTLLFLGDAFWFGHGFDPLEFSRVYKEKWVDSGFGNVVMPGAHNMVLQYFFQAGVLGAVIYVGLVVAVVSRLWILSRDADNEISSMAQALLAAWVGAYVVLGQTDSVNWPCFAVLFPITAFFLARRGE